MDTILPRKTDQVLKVVELNSMKSIDKKVKIATD